MKTFFQIIILLFVTYCVQAQTIIPIEPCAFNMSNILCKYDDNGNRIFRGFVLECPPSGRPTNSVDNSAITAKNTVTNTAQLYPNPTVAETTLSFAEMPPAGAILYVYDTQGKILIEQYADQQQMRISLAPFPAGVYLMAVLHQKKVFYSGKIGKQ